MAVYKYFNNSNILHVTCFFLSFTFIFTFFTVILKNTELQFTLFFYLFDFLLIFKVLIVGQYWMQSKVSLNTSKLNMSSVFQGNGTFVNSVVVQHHPFVLRSTDRRIDVACDYEEVQRKLRGGKQVLEGYVEELHFSIVSFS